MYKGMNGNRKRFNKLWLTLGLVAVMVFVIGVPGKTASDGEFAIRETVALKDAGPSNLIADSQYIYPVCGVLDAIKLGFKGSGFNVDNKSGGSAAVIYSGDDSDKGVTVSFLDDPDSSDVLDETNAYPGAILLRAEAEVVDGEDGAEFTSDSTNDIIALVLNAVNRDFNNYDDLSGILEQYFRDAAAKAMKDGKGVVSKDLENVHIDYKVKKSDGDQLTITVCISPL